MFLRYFSQIPLHAWKEGKLNGGLPINQKRKRLGSYVQKAGHVWTGVRCLRVVAGGGGGGITVCM